MAHAANCSFLKICDIYLYQHNDNSDDESISMDEFGISYNPSVYSGKKDCIHIPFNFCPICGTSMKEEETPIDK